MEERIRFVLAAKEEGAVMSQVCAAFGISRDIGYGEIKWKGDLIFVSQVLVGEPVAIDRTEGGEWRVRYADLELGFIDSIHRRLNRRPAPQRTARQP